MKKPDNFKVTFSELKSFSEHLHRLIKDGSFYQLPYRERYRHIRHVKQLYNRLRGPVTDVKVSRILAAATVLAFVVPIKIGPGMKYTPAGSLLVGCEMQTAQKALTTVVSQLNMAMIPAAMDRFELTISGSDMETISEEFTGDITEITIEVPAGETRLFDLTAVVDPAEHISIISYNGMTTVDLVAGETVEIELNMEPVPVDPVFAAPVQNPFGLGSDFYGFVNPVLVDLDADGDLDLLVNGYYSDGPYEHTTFWYENIGTSDAPTFAPVVQDPFGIPATGYGNQGIYRESILDVADLDNDGDIDIIAGWRQSFSSPGRFQYWENTGTSSSPSFTADVANPLPFNLSYTDYVACLTLGDLDNDGDFDLLLGDYYYDAGDYTDVFRYFENSGSSVAPDFAGVPVDNPFGLGSIPDYIVPRLVDLDGDGDLDIFVGDRAGDFHFFENTGSTDAPDFATPVQNPFGLVNTIISSDAVPAFGDMDGDGDLDLFIGENATNIWYFENEAL